MPGRVLSILQLAAGPVHAALHDRAGLWHVEVVGCGCPALYAADNAALLALLIYAGLRSYEAATV